MQTRRLNSAESVVDPKRACSTRLSAWPPTQPPIRLFVADKHEVIRIGIRVLFQGEKSVKVVGEAGNMDELLTEIQRTNPHVVLLEFGFTGGSTVDVCKQLFAARPLIRVIIVGSGHGTNEFSQALETGAQAFLPRNFSGVDLIQTVHSVFNGGPYRGPGATANIFRLLQQEQKGQGIHSMLQTLSTLERRMVALIADGNAEKEIAANLQLSERTVSSYVSHIFNKLEIWRRTQAVALHPSAELSPRPIGKKIST